MAAIYLLTLLTIAIFARNVIALVILGSVLEFMILTLVGSYQTGIFQMYQGGGTARSDAPQKFWFHLCTQTALWLIMNLMYGLAFWKLFEKIKFYYE